ncbi:DoxX family protein [Streptomyces montanisoli]|uniref:DoxX family membrane protein n=1 Tax=Streptomyces montanisoli TaxID=2798581 RepID=A0A940RWB1_9ACTN|nr:hypothetical protein [Streptomyces montanisoli]MBP0456938.1 hypothetical protein [Streptomyces montanisoli]
MRLAPRSPRLLAGLLGSAGVLHFARPLPFDTTVPRLLPGSARTWTYVSGAVELGLAAAVAAPRTRRAASLAAAGFFVAVLPANVQMAVDWRDKPAAMRAAAYARLPLQAPLVAWAIRASRDARG